jgi:trimethylamine--corrinoid protein Co-methyltransferase
MYETMLSLFGAVLGGCNMLIPRRGWLEGGLTASKEKFVLDVEVLQMLAETFSRWSVDDDEIALDAIGETPPGRPFLRRGAHTAALPDRRLRAARLRLVELRPVETASGITGRVERSEQIWKQALAVYERTPWTRASAAGAGGVSFARRTGRWR